MQRLSAAVSTTCCMMHGLSAPQVRFLFPVLPLFNAVAAAGLARIWQFCRQQHSTKILWHLGASGAALVCLGVVLTASAASHFNYPGGTALQQLHAATNSSVRHLLRIL
jgi:hypothetical protein